MRGHLSSFRVPKHGSSVEECEDAIGIGPAPLCDGGFDRRYLRVAVADGASEAVLAGRWANELVQKFALAPSSADLGATLDRAIDGWTASVATYIEERESAETPIQWYEEPGLDRGAYATVVALRLVDPSTNDGLEGAFDAWALGDACLFQVRDDVLIASFPLDDAGAFDSSPQLVPSKPAATAVVRDHILHATGTWRSGDLFLMATDALSHWFLTEVSHDRQPWSLWRDFDTNGCDYKFDDWVADRRTAGELRNDDTTLLRIDLF